VNDECHDYGTMQYYITLEQQRRQLQAAGFGAATVYDSAGNRADEDNGRLGDTMLLVVRG